MKKHYDVEFKKEVVREFQSGKSLNELFAIYEIPKSTITGWVKKYSDECSYTNPITKENNISAKEVRALNKQILELKKENDFLKKAAAFFAKEID